jgi:transposase
VGTDRAAATTAEATPLHVSSPQDWYQIETQRVAVVRAIVPVGGLRGRPLSGPGRVYSDRGYVHDKYRSILHERRMPTSITGHGQPNGSGLGKVRWLVERTHAGLHHFRRLRIRSERRANVHEAFLNVRCSLICWNTLKRAQQSL